MTHASRRAAASEEGKVDLSVLERALAERRVLALHEVSSADMVESYLFTDRVPDGAVVIDVREEEAWEEWHYPGAVRRDQWELAAHLREMDRDRTYVLYCDAGMQAAFLAEQMQRSGLEAYAMRGGTRALRSRAEQPAT